MKNTITTVKLPYGYNSGPRWMNNSFLLFVDNVFVGWFEPVYETNPDWTAWKEKYDVLSKEAKYSVKEQTVPPQTRLCKYNVCSVFEFSVSDVLDNKYFCYNLEEVAVELQRRNNIASCIFPNGTAINK